MRTVLAEMGHPQPPSLVATDKTETNIILNGTEKQKRSREIDIRFYWVCDRIRQNNLHI